LSQGILIPSPFVVYAQLLRGGSSRRSHVASRKSRKNAARRGKNARLLKKLRLRGDWSYGGTKDFLGSAEAAKQVAKD